MGRLIVTTTKPDTTRNWAIGDNRTQPRTAFGVTGVSGYTGSGWPAYCTAAGVANYGVPGDQTWKTRDRVSAADGTLGPANAALGIAGAMKGTSSTRAFVLVGLWDALASTAVATFRGYCDNIVTQLSSAWGVTDYKMVSVLPLPPASISTTYSAGGYETNRLNYNADLSSHFGAHYISLDSAMGDGAAGPDGVVRLPTSYCSGNNVDLSITGQKALAAALNSYLI